MLIHDDVTHEYLIIQILDINLFQKHIQSSTVK